MISCISLGLGRDLVQVSVHMKHGASELDKNTVFNANLD